MRGEDVMMDVLLFGLERLPVSVFGTEEMLDAGGSRRLWRLRARVYFSERHVLMPNDGTKARSALYVQICTAQVYCTIKLVHSPLS